MVLFSKLLRFVVLLSLMTAASSAQSQLCDSRLEDDPQNPYGYRLRGDRCEGSYKRPVSSQASSTLLLVSFTEPLQGVDVSGSQKITFLWRPPAQDGQVILSVESLRSGTNYRMNTTLPASQGSYAWSPAMLARHGLRNDEVGILAQTPGSSSRPVYLPLRLASETSHPTAAKSFRITIVPTTRLEEVSWSLARLEDGQCRDFIVREKDLQRAPYVAGLPIVFGLDRAAKKGTYCLTFHAVTADGAPDVLNVSFYDAG